MEVIGDSMAISPNLMVSASRLGYFGPHANQIAPDADPPFKADIREEVHSSHTASMAFLVGGLLTLDWAMTSVEAGRGYRKNRGCIHLYIVRYSVGGISRLSSRLSGVRTLVLLPLRFYWPSYLFIAHHCLVL